MEANTTTATDHLLRIDAVLSTLSISRATLYKGVAAGQLPAPLKIGSASRWRWSEIAAVMAGTYERQ